MAHAASNDWLQTQTLANGSVANYTLNPAGQLTRLLNQQGGNTVSDFSSIAYDGAGNRTSITASIPGATGLNGTTGYNYDSKDQLNQETSTRNSGFTDNFDYDTAGNPASFKGVTKAYNSNNQQTGTGFVHDGNGNPTTYNNATLTFDSENRLTAHGSTLTAGYTGDGLRAWKQSTGNRTYFLHDGIVPVVELNQLGVVNATNTFGAAGLVSRRAGISPLAISLFYSFDSQGSVAQKSDVNGLVVSNHLFSAHGSNLSGTMTDPFGYKAQFGYYTDNETGLQLLTHRYYDQGKGRFLTRDPIGYHGGINLYAYVGNNSVNLIDPLGFEGGPINYLRDPFTPTEWTWPLNGISNTISDMLNLDSIASWSYTAGNHCLPDDVRAAAAAKALGSGAVSAFGGLVLKRAGGMVMSGLGRRAGSGGRMSDLPGLPGSAPRPLGLGNTGRAAPGNLGEQLAMEQVMSNPAAGRAIPLAKGMTDPRWPASQGWIKMGKSVNGHNIHYVRNIFSGAVDDFKFK